MLQIESDLRRYLDDAERCITGVLTLGGAMLFTSYVLPPLLSTFSERYPGVELRLHEAPTARLKEQLQEGTLDFAVDNSAFDPAVYEARLFKRRTGDSGRTVRLCGQRSGRRASAFPPPICFGRKRRARRFPFFKTPHF